MYKRQGTSLTQTQNFYVRAGVLGGRGSWAVEFGVATAGGDQVAVLSNFADPNPLFNVNYFSVSSGPGASLLVSNIQPCAGSLGQSLGGAPGQGSGAGGAGTPTTAPPTVRTSPPSFQPSSQPSQPPSSSGVNCGRFKKMLPCMSRSQGQCRWSVVKCVAVGSG